MTTPTGEGMSEAETDAEQRLAVLTSWGLFGAFSLALVATGFRADHILVAAAGYLVLVAGFVSHLIINRIYGMGFRSGEIAAGISLFGLAAFSFLVFWAFDPAFTLSNALSGLLGLAVAAACFVVYLATRFGLKGAFSMFHIHRN